MLQSQHPSTMQRNVGAPTQAVSRRWIYAEHFTVLYMCLLKEELLTSFGEELGTTHAKLPRQVVRFISSLQRVCQEWAARE